LAVDHLADGDGRADTVRSAAGDQSAHASGVAYERISIDPNRMSGLPCIRDSLVTVSAVPGQLAAGLTIPELPRWLDAGGSRGTDGLVAI